MGPFCFDMLPRAHTLHGHLLATFGLAMPIAAPYLFILFIIPSYFDIQIQFPKFQFSHFFHLIFIIFVIMIILFTYLFIYSFLKFHL